MVLEWDPDWTKDTRRSYESSSLSHRTGIELKTTTVSTSLPSIVSSISIPGHHGGSPNSTSVRGTRWRTQSIIGDDIWVYEQDDFDHDSNM